jgi:uncharacterized membrane protein YfcA
MRIVLYLSLGAAIGTVSGTVGIGGGVLLVPVLMWLCGMDYPKAAGTTIAVLAQPVGLMAAWNAWRENRVDLEAAIWIAVAFAGGAYLGTVLFDYLPVRTLRFAFGVLLLFVAMRYVLSSSDEAASAAAGLVACGFAWLSYFGLSRLGRRHLPAPDLGTHIRIEAEKGRGESEYYI